MSEDNDKTKGCKKQNIILLDYRSWIIEVEDNFPSINYVVRKKNDSGYHRVAYCGSLESALKTIYNVMLLDTVNRRNNYGARFKDLKNVILETKNEFTRLIDVNLMLQAEIKRGDVESGNN